MRRKHVLRTFVGCLALSAGLIVSSAPAASAGVFDKGRLDLPDGAGYGKYTVTRLSGNRYKVNLWIFDGIRDGKHCVFLRSTLQVDPYWIWVGTASTRTRICDDGRRGTHRYSPDSVGAVAWMTSSNVRLAIEVCEDRHGWQGGDRCISHITPTHRHGA